MPLKKLIQLIQQTDNMDIMNQIQSFDNPFLPSEAGKEFNSLVLALAATTPYRNEDGRESSWCIHCGRKFYKPDENNMRALHDESCVWLRAWELAELCRQK